MTGRPSGRHGRTRLVPVHEARPGGFARAPRTGAGGDAGAIGQTGVRTGVVKRHSKTSRRRPRTPVRDRMTPSARGTCHPLRPAPADAGGVAAAVSVSGG